MSKKNRQHNGQKEKVQKDKQWSTKHTYKTKDRVTRTPLKTGSELGCSGSSCSTSDTRRVNLVTNPVISHERGKDREVFTTSGTYPWSFLTLIFHNGQPSHGGDRKTFEMIPDLIKMISLHPHPCFLSCYDQEKRTNNDLQNIHIKLKIE